MPRILAGVLAFGLGIVCCAADPYEDFSGRWKLDRARSESASQSVPVGQMTLVIRQTATELSVETTISDGQNSGVSMETLTYKLDGTESSIASGSGAPIKTRARWDGAKLVTETVRHINSAAVVMQNVLSLAQNKKELTVNRTLTVEHGYQSPGGNNTGTGKDVFVRTSDSSLK